MEYRSKSKGLKGSKLSNVSNGDELNTKYRHQAYGRSNMCIHDGGCSGSNPAPRKFPLWKVFKPQFHWNQKLGHGQCPYLVRWVIGFLLALRLHHWISSDDMRNFHDHSWWFWTLVLKGGYTDISEKGEEHLTAGSLKFRPAYHKHSVKVDKGGCWTLLLTGPEMRYWGFWVGKKFKKANKYFLEHGHHPCE